VPTFVFDEQFVVEGAQPPEAFVQVLEEVRRRSGEAA
jgi:predicted DsbA family dithiol-disulfide isomerase